MIPALPLERKHNETEAAFRRFRDDKLTVVALAGLDFSRAKYDMFVALLRAAFMEGARYATERCDAEGHHQ